MMKSGEKVVEGEVGKETVKALKIRTEEDTYNKKLIDEIGDC